MGPHDPVPYYHMFPVSPAYNAIGVFGYPFRKLDGESALLMLGFILGPMVEQYLRRALLLFNGNVPVLVERPVGAVLLVLAEILVAIVVAPAIRKKRTEAFQEEV